MYTSRSKMGELNNLDGCRVDDRHQMSGVFFCGCSVLNMRCGRGSQTFDALVLKLFYVDGVHYNPGLVVLHKPGSDCGVDTRWLHVNVGIPKMCVEK